MQILKIALLLMLVLRGALIVSKIDVFFSPQDRPAAKLIDEINAAKTRVLAAIYMLTDKKVAQSLIAAHQRGVEVKIILDRTSFESPWGKTIPLAGAGVKVFLLNQQQAKIKAKTEIKKTTEDQIVQDEEASLEANEQTENITSTSQEKLTGVAESNSTIVKTLKKPGTYSSMALMHNKFAIIDDKIWTGSFNWTISANNKNHENALLISQEPAVVQSYTNYFNQLIDNAKALDLPTVEGLRRDNLTSKKPVILPQQPPGTITEVPMVPLINSSAAMPVAQG